jgi:hypothetical protein
MACHQNIIMLIVNQNKVPYVYSATQTHSTVHVLCSLFRVWNASSIGLNKSDMVVIFHHQT